MTAARIELRVQLQLADFVLDVDVATSAQSLGIFGPSGAGKTSLLEAVAGWRKPRSGRCRVEDTTLFDSDAAVSQSIEKRGVGYVPQDALLFPHKSVIENIRSGSSRGSANASDEAVIERTIKTLEIEHLLKRQSTQLSGGERQRVSLARAIASRPRILLLDEPLGSLDAPLRRRILPYLIRVRKEFALPTLFVSHDATEVQALCDDVVILERGKVREQGVPGKLLRRVASGSRAYENVLGGVVSEVRGNSAFVRLDGTGHGEVNVPARGLVPGAHILFALGADDILVALDRPSRISARNIIEASIDAVVHGENDEVRVDLRLLTGEGPAVSASLTKSSVDELRLQERDKVFVVFKTSACAVLSVN